MRRITRILGLLCMTAIVAVSASSCKKNKDNASFNIQLGQLQGLNMDERAYIDVYDGCQMKWNLGDEIMIYNLASDYTQSEAKVYTNENGDRVALTTFTSNDPVSDRFDIGYFYFYPAYKASGNLQADNRETFTVANTQTYDENTIFDPTSLVMAAEVENITDQVIMDHIFGFLNLKVTSNNPAHLDNIVITDNSFNLSGEMSLKLPEVSAETFTELLNQCESGDPNYAENLAAYLQQLGYESNGDGKTITLDCGGTEINGTKKYFFVSLRPGALLNGGTITFNFVEDDMEPTVLNIEPGQFIVKPGWFCNFTCGI